MSFFRWIAKILFNINHLKFKFWFLSIQSLLLFFSQIAGFKHFIVLVTLIKFVWPPGEGNGETKAAVPTVPTPQSWRCRDGPADDQCLQRFLQSLPLVTLLPTDYEFHLLFHANAGETGPMVTTTLKLGISILNGGNSEVQRVCILD